MCLQSLSLWAEATRYRVQRRRAAPGGPAQMEAPPERLRSAEVVVEPVDADRELATAGRHL